MEKQTQPWLLNQRSSDIRCLSIDKASLEKILNLIQERNYDAGKLELALYKELPDMTDEKYAADENKIMKGFDLYISVNGKVGQRTKTLNGSVKDVFSSTEFPDEVLAISVDTELPLKILHNWNIKNSLKFILDFRKPGIFDFSLQPSHATSNLSNITIKGKDAGWVNGLIDEINNILTEHPSHLTWIHQSAIYDLLVWILGIPAGFYVCSKASSLIMWMAPYSVFVQNTAYTLIFFASLLGLRVLFQYTRWIWPLVEYRSSKNKAIKHRTVWGMIMVSLAGTLIFELFKLIF